MMRTNTSFVLGGLLLLIVGFALCHDHSHDHSHDEAASFKWSREANEGHNHEDEILDEDIIDLPPQYASGGHGHSHGGHGHSHGGHGHSHGGHGHSHGSPQRELTPEEREKHRARLHKEWDDDEDEEATAFFAPSSVWINALLSVLAISVAPFAILFFFTLDNSEENQGFLKILLSFASGGLLGDAFLHLIPHAIMAQEGNSHTDGNSDQHHGHSHAHGHSHGGDDEGHSHDLTIGLGVLSGILTFLVIEKIVRIYGDGHGHSHGHSHGPEKSSKEIKSKEKPTEKNEKKKEAKESKTNVDEPKEKDVKDPQTSGYRIAGYLNLFADFFHNFTDGLAIGASFLAGNTIGFFTTFTILFHEIPHEIGDYAILIQSGVEPFKAKMLQLLTAVGALAGCLVSLIVGGVGNGVSIYVMPFTAGGFIYIATVSVIPELLEGSSLLQSLKEICALLLGVFMMIVISWYE